MIIDWQHHFSPKAISDKRGGKAGQPVMEKGMVGLYIHEEVYTVEKHLQFMEETGIDKCVLSATLSSVEDCKLTDDAYVVLGKEYPDRFVCLAPCIPTRGKAAFEELERAMDLGLKGVAISPQNDGHALDAKEMWPFYEKMARWHVPVFIHITNTPVGYDALQANFHMNFTLSRELDLIANTVRLILGGVLSDFPDLKLVIAHMGGGVAALLDRTENFIETFQEKFWTDAGGIPPFGEPYVENFREQFKKLYFDIAGCGGQVNTVKIALTSISPDRLVFGTDWPYEFRNNPEGIKKYIEDIRQLAIPPDSIDNILGNTAAKLLGI
jgi:predicted TIM-barrel fold metal-dependent hydrolase